MSENIKFLTSSLKEYMAEGDLDFVMRGLDYAQEAHLGVNLECGDDYITHPIHVATTLSKWRADKEIVVAGLLHDIQKENYSRFLSLDPVSNLFGDKVVYLLENIDKLGRGGIKKNKDIHVGLKSNSDIVVKQSNIIASVFNDSYESLIIKLADRLDNFRTLSGLKDIGRQQNYAARTLNIFVPIADRLGMRVTRIQLEDNSFQILQPNDYKSIDSRFSKEKWHPQLESIANEVAKILEGLEGGVTIDWARIPKIKIYRYKNESRSELFKLSGILPLIIVGRDIDQCYRILGRIHQMWKPQPFSLRDFIAAPKTNGYQSIHTKIEFGSFDYLNLLIRTETMHKIAKYGITAKWLESPVEELWVKPQETKNNDEKIQVMTPSGDIKNLTKNSNPIDFAYAIHSDVGHRLERALVNNVVVPLEYQLSPGDVVSVNGDGKSPDLDWLEIVKTEKAKREIIRWYRHNKPQGLIDKGVLALDLALQDGGHLISAKEIYSQLTEVAPEFGATAAQELLADIGMGRVESKLVADFLSGVPVDMAALAEDSETIDWEDDGIVALAEINLLVQDRLGMVADITGIMKQHGVEISYIEARRINQHDAQIKIGVVMARREQLQRTHLQFNLVPGVLTNDLSIPSGNKEVVDGAIAVNVLRNPFGLLPAKGGDFYGRDKELRDLESSLGQLGQGEGVLLWGPRRIGKTSLLVEFHRRLLHHPDIYPVYIDMQALSGSDVASLLHRFMSKVYETLKDDRVRPPALSKVQKNPISYFNSFVRHGLSQLDKKIIFIIDEFQYLDRIQPTNDVHRKDVFRNFRSLIQQNEFVTILLGGGGVLKKLLEDDSLTSLMEIGHELQLSCMTKEESDTLFREELNHFSIQQEALDFLWSLTHGHPYFMQLLGTELFFLVNPKNIMTIIEKDIQDAVDILIAYDEHIFAHLWGTDSNIAHENLQPYKLLLIIIACRCETSDCSVSAKDLLSSELNQVMGESEINRACRELEEIETIVKFDHHSSRYGIKVDLLRIWLRNNYTVESQLKECEL